MFGYDSDITLFATKDNDVYDDCRMISLIQVSKFVLMIISVETYVPGTWLLFVLLLFFAKRVTTANIIISIII
jgi:hypothetical protein